MKSIFLKSIFAFIIMICLCSCFKWHNKRTGEVRSSVPVYPECKKEQPEYVVDKSCWYSCMDYYYKKFGASNAGACDKQCTKPTGRMILIDDDDCNAKRAREEGWELK